MMNRIFGGFSSFFEHPDRNIVTGRIKLKNVIAEKHLEDNIT